MMRTARMAIAFKVGDQVARPDGGFDFCVLAPPERVVPSQRPALELSLRVWVRDGRGHEFYRFYPDTTRLYELVPAHRRHNLPPRKDVPCQTK